MKNYLGMLFLMLMLASCNQVKIAYVEIEEVMKEYEGSKMAEVEIKAQSEKIMASLDSLAIPFQQRVQEYQQNSAGMSSSQRQEREQQLMREEQMIRQQQQLAQQQVQQESSRMLDQINEEIESFVTNYAETNGYAYILGTSSQTKTVLYGKEGLDLTDEIIEALNAQYKSDDKSDASEETSAPVN